MKVRSLCKRLSLVGLGALLAFVVAEAGLRLFWPQGQITDELRYEALPGADESGPGYRLQPGLWIPGPQGGPVNSLGLRGPELGAKRGRRVLVLGDSFVFGAGVAVDQALPAQLAQRVSEGSPTEFVNAGTPGYGTARELAWLESYGAPLAPDELLLCVFLGNDFSDNLDSAAPRVVGGQLFLEEGDLEAAGWRLRLRALGHRLHLWRLIERRRLSGAEPTDAVPVAASDLAARAAGLEKVLAAFARHEAGRLAIYLPEDAPDSAAARRVAVSYDLTRLALEGIAAWCLAHDVALEVVAIPDVLAVDDSLRARALAQGEFPDLEGFDVTGLDYERPTRSLASWCEQLGLPSWNLTPQFRARTAELVQETPGGEGLYLFGDSHWNAAGHAFAAECITAWRRARAD